MAKEYWIKFATDQLNATAGLAPTLILFRSWTGAAVTAPGITQPVASFGLYRFEYSPSFSIVFVCDGATTSLGSNRYVSGTLDPADSVDERLAEVGSTLVAVGNTAVALGNTGVALGTTNGLNIISFGSTGNAIGTTILGYGVTILGVGTTTVGYAASIYAQGLSGLSADILNRIGSTASSFGTTGTDPGEIFGFLKRAQEFNEGNSSFNKSTGAWQIKTRGSTLLREKTLTDAASTVTKT